MLIFKAVIFIVYVYNSNDYYMTFFIFFFNQNICFYLNLFRKHLSWNF